MKEKVVYSKKAVAQFFEVTPQTIGNWLRRGCPGKRADGGYVLHEIALWRDHGEEGGGSGRQPELPVQRGKDYEEQRLRKAKADLAEAELRRIRSESILISKLEPMLTARAWAYRQGLLGFEQKLPPLLANAFGLPQESMRAMVVIIRQEAKQVLENVLTRPIVLPNGQAIVWEQNSELFSEKKGDDHHESEGEDSAHSDDG